MMTVEITAMNIDVVQLYVCMYVHVCTYKECMINSGSSRANSQD